MQMATGNLKVQATSRQMQGAHTDIWLQLNQINLKPITVHTALSEGKLTFSDALQYFAEHSHAKITTFGMSYPVFIGCTRASF